MNKQLQAPLYNILLEGHPDSRWSKWLDNMTITLLGSGETLLSGPVADQAALHGLMAKIRDMSISLFWSPMSLWHWGLLGVYKPDWLGYFDDCQYHRFS